MSEERCGVTGRDLTVCLVCGCALGKGFHERRNVRHGARIRLCVRCAEATVAGDAEVLACLRERLFS